MQISTQITEQLRSNKLLVTILLALMLMAVSLSSASASNPLSTTTITDGLIAHYELDGNANDSSGNGNTAIIYGATPITDRFGNADGAYYFDGNDYIQTPVQDSIDTVSFSAWFKADTIYGEHSIVDSDQSGRYGHSLILGYWHGDGELDIQYHDGPVPSNTTSVGNTGFYPSANQWYHVLVSHGDAINVYVDGQLIASWVYASSAADGGNFRIGKHNRFDPQFFIGTIDDVRFYGKTLSTEEAEAIYAEEANNDSDSDGVNDDIDNCVDIANADQANFDGDAEGDACDIDDDNDGVADVDDKYPFDPTRSENSAPVIGAISLPAEPIDVNNQPAAGVSADFSDADEIDSHTCTVDFGDGSGPVAGTVSGMTCLAPDHTYTSAGVYEVTFTVADNDGGSDSETSTSFVVIYDPSGGFVTGGGWINSPAGAYAADPAATGKANFGFVSKYKKGANVPTGQTEFQFKAGDLNFHSSSYEWLVIAGKDKAKYKGVGTINGTGNYGFMVTAIDNGNGGDTFRIKIWDKDSGDGVVYDNQMGSGDDAYNGTTIGGGNIKVHSK